MSGASFASDNHAGAHPDVLRAIVAANTGDAPAYGADTWTRRMEECFSDHFGSEAHAFACFNGTGANVLGLSVLLRPYEAVICAETAHLYVDECGASERHLGVKLLDVHAPDGKITPGHIAAQLGGRGDEHRVQPRVVALSQPTELGTCYTLDELSVITETAHAYGLFVHVDGARLANAAVTLGCSLREAAAGADVVSFGGTKNGLLGADAVVVLRPELAHELHFARKQGLHLASKMRFLSAQLIALLEGDLWLHNAAHANAMAQRLATGVQSQGQGQGQGQQGQGVAAAGPQGHPVQVRYPVESNAVFASLHPEHIARLQLNYAFHVWDAEQNLVRWMTSFDTSEDDVDAFLADIAHVTSSTLT